MPLAWSSTGSFSSSLITDSASVTDTYTRTLPLVTVPPGTYGSLPVLVFLQAGKSPNLAQHFLYTASYTFPSAQTPGVGGPSKNNASRFGIYSSRGAGLGDVQPAFSVGYFVPHSGLQSANDPSTWDSGFTISAGSSLSVSTYVLRGTFSTVVLTPDLTGTSSFLTQDTFVGARLNGFWGGDTNVGSITDDTHLATNTNALFTFSNLLGPTTNSLEDIKWIAALINLPYSSVNQPFPASQTADGTENVVTASLSTPQLLNSTGALDGLTGTSIDTTFGSLITDHSGLTFDEILTDTNCVDALAIVQGYTSQTPPFSIDLVNGNPNWQMIGSTSTTGLNGQLSTFSAMAHWTRPATDDTSLKWSGIPVTPPYSVISPSQPFPDHCTAACDIWVWPSGFPGSSRGHNRGYVIA